MPRVWQVIQLLALLYLTFHCAPYGAARDAFPFRCMRPFSSLTRFKASAMDPRERCLFGPFVVTSATATPQCARDDSAERPATTCAALLSLSFAAPQPPETPRPSASASAASASASASPSASSAADDALRFALELRSGAGSVRYKGFDQNGYSVCCGLLHNATCTWGGEAEGNGARQQREPDVRTCPIFEVAPGEAFYGSVRKPLYENTVGKWTAQLMFWRTTRDGRETLGRLDVPFFLTEEIINAAEGSDNATMSNNALVTFSEDDEGKQKEVPEENEL